jgi:outer membrane receptor protein involved in Fe transport
VYGSDAIAGVVNFVTDTKFNGIKFNIQGGESNYGDDATGDIGIALGKSFADGKGHIEASYEYHNDPGITYRTARQFGRDVWTTQADNAAGTAYSLIENSTYNKSAFGGLITSGTGAGKYFSGNGVLSPFSAGSPTYTGSSYSSGGDGDYYDGSLKNTLQSDQIFGRFDYDVTENVHAYVSVSDTINHTLNYGAYNVLTNDTFNAAQNPYAQAAGLSSGTFKLSEFLSDMGRVDTNTHENQYNVVAGLSGKFGGSYNWSVAYSRSQAQATTIDNDNVNTQNLSAALDVVNGPNGPECYAATVSSAYSNCVPLDVFGPTAASGAALAYITSPTQFTVTNGLDDISGSISGAPFSDWAGPITTALSAEWRQETLAVASTAQPSQTANCAYLRYNCTAATATSAATALYLDATLANLPTKSESIGEVALETEVPLLKDKFLVKDLSFNGAVRFADYSVSGKALVWKIGGVWQVTDDWKLRATRSHDFRAPTLYDLYQPEGVSLTTHEDYLTGVDQPTTTITNGNPKLQPEQAETTTAGMVYQPSWLPRFSISADAYYIDIANAIESENAYGSNSVECYPPYSAPYPDFCSLIVRPYPNTNTTAANAVTEWLVKELNIADFKTYGLDVEANYAASLWNNPLTFRGLMSWQPHLYQVAPATPTTDLAGFAFASLGGGPSAASPRVKVLLFADYKFSNFDIGVTETWRSSLNFTNTEGIVVTPGSIGPAYYTDVNLAYMMHKNAYGSLQLFLNVQNLFNTPPQPIAGASQNSNIGTYGGFAIGDDAIGRYITIGLRFRH